MSGFMKQSFIIFESQTRGYDDKGKKKKTFLNKKKSDDGRKKWGPLIEK